MSKKSYAREMAEALVAQYPGAVFPAKEETIAQMAALGFWWNEQRREFKPFPLTERHPQTISIGNLGDHIR